MILVSISAWSTVWLQPLVQLKYSPITVSSLTWVQSDLSAVQFKAQPDTVNRSTDSTVHFSWLVSLKCSVITVCSSTGSSLITPTSSALSCIQQNTHAEYVEMLYITTANCPVYFKYTMILQAERKFNIQYTILVLLVRIYMFSIL